MNRLPNPKTRVHFFWGSPHDPLRSFLYGPEIAPNSRHHLLPVRRPLPSQCIGFGVVVQQLVRVQVRAVTGKLVQADSLPVPVHPVPHRLAPVDRVPVNDQYTFFPDCLSRRPRNLKKTVRVKRSWKTMKVSFP